MSQSSSVVVLRESDDVAVASVPLPAGTTVQVSGHTVTARTLIPSGHKIALRAIAKGAAVHKYASRIGFASTDIAPGDHVHTQNVEIKEVDEEFEFSTEVPDVDYFPESEIPTFDGYLRSDGRAGTRNYIALLSTVNCSATVTNAIADRVNATILKDYPNVDGVAPLTHFTGCAPKPGVAGYDDLTMTLAGFARNSNVGDYFIIGLGCEGTQASSMIEHRGLVQIGNPSQKPKVLGIQQCGGVQKTIDEGVRIIAEMLPRVNEAVRTPQPISKLMLAMECGGSDAWSGITANPAVGVASDLLVRYGATTILSETTECIGAEHLLMRRAVSREVGEKLLDRIAWWRKYLAMYGMVADNNPSPGNVEGGLTNIIEKSLGAVAKGGSMPLVEVYDYAAPVRAKGFVIMDTPGYDPPSVTGMVAGGANIVVFTTGRGSCFGFKPSPSIKIVTNTMTYNYMQDDMDINAGVILEGTSVEAVGRQIFEEIIAVASGKRTKSEINGMGTAEFVPWVRGAFV